MVESSSPPSAPSEAGQGLGGKEPLRLLTQLVAAAPTNLEDPAHGRWEKPNYLRTADIIVRAARAAGLRTRVYDPVVDGEVPGEWHGSPRPNVVADLDVGAAETVLILAHYDVVPVPVEQLARWRSPPHTLTLRADGRLYGRGAADDLGSGVVAGVTAMRRLADDDRLPRNLRLVVCCDEETGGQGGVEAIKEHDERLAADDPERILRGDVALIVDGGTDAIAGSSGLAFLEGSFDRPVPLADAVAFGRALVGLHELARTWRSIYPSPDWPDRGAPEPVLTGRATVTMLDLAADLSDRRRVRPRAVRSETDAGNQIARSVTLVLDGPSTELATIEGRLAALVEPPFQLARDGTTALPVPEGAVVVQVVGEAAHGGYPHRGRNPVPPALLLLDRAMTSGLLDGGSVVRATYTVDLRLIPEMELDAGVGAALEQGRAWIAQHASHARLEAPPTRCRSGYALPLDHPALAKLSRILNDTLGAGAIRGEYGGTDASALRTLRTPSGAPLPALVFGAMDPAAHIHDAEESLDPRLFAGVVTAIERFVREP